LKQEKERTNKIIEQASQKKRRAHRTEIMLALYGHHKNKLLARYDYWYDHAGTIRAPKNKYEHYSRTLVIKF
jgi:hypothetical protein